MNFTDNFEMVGDRVFLSKIFKRRKIGDTIECSLKRIRAKRNFTTFNGIEIKKGQLGGYINTERYYNHSFLSSNSWIDEKSILFLSVKSRRGFDLYLKNSVVIYPDLIFGSLVAENTVSCGTKVCGWVEMKNAVATVRGITLKHGTFTSNNFENIKNVIFCATGKVPDENGNYIFYKDVFRIDNERFQSAHDSSFIYRMDEEAEAKPILLDKRVSCASGLHVANKDYCFDGDTKLKCRVHIDDVITCVYGKLRVKKLTPIAWEFIL